MSREQRVDMGGNQVPDDWRACWSCDGIGVVPARGLSARFKCGPCCGLGLIPPEQAGPPTAEETANVRAWIESVRLDVLDPNGSRTATGSGKALPVGSDRRVGR